MRNALSINPSIRTSARIYGSFLAACLISLSPLSAVSAGNPEEYYYTVRMEDAAVMVVAYDEAAGVLTIARGLETSDPE